MHFTLNKGTMMKNLISLLAIFLTLNASAGKLQNEDFKSLSELTAAGGSASQLLNTSKLYDVGTSQQLSTAFSSSIVGSLMTKSKVSLTTDVNNTLPVANGGTGASTLTLNSVLLGNGTSTVQQIAPGNNGNVLTSNGTTWTSGPAPSGGGSKNYLTNYLASTGSGTVNTGNGNIELGSTTGFSLFNTTLTSGIPTGSISAGAASITTFAASTSNVLAGAYSLNVASSGAISAGQGFITDAFYIDSADQAKVMTISADYTVISGASNLNFSGTSSNTFAAYIYDVTNSAWIQPAGVYNLVQSSGKGKLTATFQSTSNSTQYRLAILAVNASAGASSMNWDSFSVGPQSTATGVPATDWTSWSLTVGATTTPPTEGSGVVKGAWWRRVGDSIEIRYNYNQTGAGSAGSGTYLFPLPNGLQIDLTKLNAGSGTVGVFGTAVGSGHMGEGDTTSSMKPVMVVPYSASYLRLTTDVNGTSSQPWGSGQSNSYADPTLNYSFEARVPVVGWSSNVNMSNDTDTREVIAIVTGTHNAATAGNVVIWPTVTKDSHGGYSTSTGRYTVPVSGDYEVNFTISGSNTGATYGVYKNGSVWETVGQIVANPSLNNGKTTVPCVAGDIIDVRMISSSTATVSTATTATFKRVSGPATVAASELVAAKYHMSANATPGANVQINFDTKDYDSHGAVTTGAGAWKFTAPISGKYRVTGYWNMSGGSSGAIEIFKNGSAITDNAFATGNNTGNYSEEIQLNAGDFIDVRSTGATTFIGSNSPLETRLSIARIGN